MQDFPREEARTGSEMRMFYSHKTKGSAKAGCKPKSESKAVTNTKGWRLELIK